MSWRVRFNEHFPGGSTNIALGGGASVRSTGDTDVSENPPDVYPDVAPNIGTTRYTDFPFVAETLTITRSSDGHEYVEGTDFEENAPDSWTNLAITAGTGIVVHYFIESDLQNSGIQLQLEGLDLPESDTWNLAEGFEAELNPSTGAIDITALGGGDGGGGVGPVDPMGVVSLLNSWNYISGGQVPGYYMDRERVWLRGRVGGGTTAVGTKLFTLPVGYRPILLVTLLAASDNAPIPIDVQTDGDVVIGDSAFAVGVEWLSLDGLSFRVVDTTEAAFQDWGQIDILFGDPEMDMPYSELP